MTYFFSSRQMVFQPKVLYRNPTQRGVGYYLLSSETCFGFGTTAVGYGFIKTLYNTHTIYINTMSTPGYTHSISPCNNCMHVLWNPTHPHSSSQLHSPDGWQFRSFHFQIICLLLHLKFCKHQGDGVPRICQDGPLTLPAAAQASSTSTSSGTRGVTTGEIKAGNEPTGAPQGATTRVLRCQSPKRKQGGE